MESQENVIIIFDKKRDRYVDKCDDIQSIEEKESRYVIKFYNNDNKFFYYKKNVNWITNPEEINLDDYLVYINGRLDGTIEKVLRFDKWYKVFYSDKHTLYNDDEVVIKRTLKNDSTISTALSYLNEVAGYIDNKGVEYLVKQIDGIKPIEDCALVKFLQKKEVKSCQLQGSLIYPFGSNYSQIQAVKRAFTSDLSVIQGPPGTGKTQTILNIVVNALLQGKTVAVASGINEATKNVEDKMNKEGLSFLTAALGNNNNVYKFFNNQPSISRDVDDWAKLEAVSCEDLNNINAQLEKALFDQIKIPKLKKQISELCIEKALNDARYGAQNCSPHEKTIKRCNTSNEALQMAALLDIVAQKKKIGFFTKLGFYFKHGIKLTEKLIAVLGDTIDCLQNKYYELKLAELDAELVHMESIEAASHIEQLKSQSTELGKIALHKVIGERYAKYDTINFNRKNYEDKIHDFIKRYPIVFSTTNALQSCTGTKMGFLYDYLIIDEASQVNVVTACIAFACAKNVVLVGDKMQLSHIVAEEDIEKLTSIFSQYKYKLPKEIEYVRHSILDAVTEMYGDSVPNTLLNEHYRCDPHIINFCNKKFYDDKLIIQTTHKDDCGVKIIANKSNCENGKTNDRQVDIIELEILRNLKEKYPIFKEMLKSKSEQESEKADESEQEGEKADESEQESEKADESEQEGEKADESEQEGEKADESEQEGKKADESELLGIISPYCNQVKNMQKRFENQFINCNILIDTVHKFQGKEKKVIIMSTVDDTIKDSKEDKDNKDSVEDENNENSAKDKNNKNNKVRDKVAFIDDPNLINVAISRAQDILYIIASEAVLEKKGGLLHDLAKYNEYYNGVEVQETAVYSVFDLMYDEYSSVLQELKKNLMHISKYESENIIATVIRNICKSNKYGSLRFYHNYPLRNMLKIKDTTDRDDAKFISNPNTHCDFVVFDKINKEIRVAIEVDGRTHLKQVQKARDERKDRLLTAAGIKVLRLPTTAIECEEKIIEALESK